MAQAKAFVALNLDEDASDYEIARKMGLEMFEKHSHLLPLPLVAAHVQVDPEVDPRGTDYRKGFGIPSMSWRQHGWRIDVKCMDEDIFLPAIEVSMTREVGAAADDARDAARYRFLRDKPLDWRVEHYNGSWAISYGRNELDAAIDAEMPLLTLGAEPAEKQA